MLPPVFSSKRISRLMSKFKSSVTSQTHLCWQSTVKVFDFFGNSLHFNWIKKTLNPSANSISQHSGIAAPWYVHLCLKKISGKAKKRELRSKSLQHFNFLQHHDRKNNSEIVSPPPSSPTWKDDRRTGVGDMPGWISILSRGK